MSAENFVLMMTGLGFLGFTGFSVWWTVKNDNVPASECTSDWQAVATAICWFITMIFGILSIAI